MRTKGVKLASRGVSLSSFLRGSGGALTIGKTWLFGLHISVLPVRPGFLTALTRQTLRPRKWRCHQLKTRTRRTGARLRHRVVPRIDCGVRRADPRHPEPSGRFHPQRSRTAPRRQRLGGSNGYRRSDDGAAAAPAVRRALQSGSRLSRTKHDSPGLPLNVFSVRLGIVANARRCFFVGINS
jgi:hypothetical protein